MAEEIKINRMLLVLITFLVGQAIAGVVWGARLTERVLSMSEQIKEIKQTVAKATADRYTGEDAGADKANILTLIAAVNQRIEVSENRLKRVEDVVFSPPL